MKTREYAIGVDVGGTHITAALIDLHTKHLVPSTLIRHAVNADGSAEEIIECWSNAIAGVSKLDDLSICIAMPGPFNYQDGICLMRGQCKYESLYGLNVKRLLASKLHIQEDAIFLENDAACYVQGEVFGGSLIEYKDEKVIGITLGTGLGTAIYDEGRSYNADLWSWPFKEGIAEDYLSSRWFVKRWQELTNNEIKGAKELSLLAQHDERAATLFDVFGNNLADFLQEFIEKESPQAVVIGGNIARSYHLFNSPLKELSISYPSLQIIPSVLGEEAPLLGAVGSWLQSSNTLTEKLPAETIHRIIHNN